MQSTGSSNYIALVAGMIGLSVGLAPVRARAHSWYPHDCCHDRDCKPADSIEVDERGDFEVRVGNDRVWVPKSFAIRPSQDSRIHICYREEGEPTFLMPFCLFLPPGA
ncbi:MAG: hypothetical protein AB7F78_08295 [Hyphomicrobiaceae bacterium]